MIPYKMFNGDIPIEDGAIKQMENVCSLPIALKAAGMADMHSGYGLPIGGVLATDPNTVIPYAVGVDISCSMRMTVMDYPVKDLPRNIDKMKACLSRETCFGAGGYHKPPLEHPVMDDPTWEEIGIAKKYKSKAREQLGTSGTSNHFASIGVVRFENPTYLSVEDPDIRNRVDPLQGDYVALLTHSGSRGTGLQVANHYCDIAMSLHRDSLPKELLHLAWLDLDTDAGREYWAVMNLMHRYAIANHELVHKRILRHLKAHVVDWCGNSHNLAEVEEHEVNGAMRKVMVHRKGATPAHLGTIGLIPGSMTTASYVVRGKGNSDSLMSSSHGAGRTMSRSAAKNSISKDMLKKALEESGVTLMGGGVDEAQFAYKDIEAVMAAQSDLVHIIGKFTPRICRMSESKGRNTSE